MALGNQDRGNWFWRLPMTLLSLRTTVKADLGASPADLVYGEGIAVPGQLLPSPPLSDRELLERQRRTLSHLRMEVERMQPTPTSAHRTPSVHIPEDLETCTHVFVLRGGVQPTLTTPYDGPFRVIERTPEGFRIDFPGRPSDIVALARLRPAVLAAEDDQTDSQGSQQDPEELVPDSPPPPGRRPGLRTRLPEATDRVTRSAASRQAADLAPPGNRGTLSPGNASDTPGSPPSSPQRGLSPVPSSPRQSQDTREAAIGAEFPPFQEGQASSPYHRESSLPPPTQTLAPATARTFTNRHERHFSNRGGPVPAFDRDQPPASGGQHQGGDAPPRRRVLSFSKPQPGNFSFRRRRPDVSALNAILRSHLSQ